LGLIALAVVIALGWALAPAARAVDLVANRAGRAAPDAGVAGIPMSEVHFSATAGGLVVATFGHCCSKKQTIFGYKLHLLIPSAASSATLNWLPPTCPT
jgi:hypothetical protein